MPSSWWLPISPSRSRKLPFKFGLCAKMPISTYQGIYQISFVWCRPLSAFHQKRQAVPGFKLIQTQLIDLWVIAIGLQLYWPMQWLEDPKLPSRSARSYLEPPLGLRVSLSCLKANQPKLWLMTLRLNDPLSGFAGPYLEHCLEGNKYELKPKGNRLGAD